MRSSNAPRDGTRRASSRSGEKALLPVGVSFLLRTSSGTVNFEDIYVDGEAEMKVEVDADVTFHDYCVVNVDISAII